MSKRISIVLLLQLCLFFGHAFAEGVTITIPAEVRVDGPFMTLGEIAVIKGDDREQITRLEQLKIGSSPLPSNSMLLTKELILMRLAATGIDFSHINWNVPVGVTVTRNSQSIEGKAFLDKGLVTIKEQIGSSVNQGDLSILPVSNVRDLVTPVGDSVITSSLPYGIRYNTPTTVRIIVAVNGQTFTTLNLKFDVKLYRQVVVAANQVGQGEILTSEKVRYERMDTGHLGTGYYTDMKKMMGLATRRPLSPGMVITDIMLNKPIVIKRGDLVQMIARVGSMEVTVVGKAMQDGYEGQLIRIQNVNSNKFVSAKVLGEGMVQVLTYSRK